MAEGRTARRQVQDRYRLLIESIVDYAIYMIDQDGHVASWNPGARRLKGYEADEILGLHFSQFYTPEDRAAGEPLHALERAARDGRFENEGWRVRKDGRRFWASVVIDAIRDVDGTLLGFAKITRDISEKREAQLALAQVREELFQAQKLETIGQMTGGIAHDFNNLLTAILGSLHLLQKRLPQDGECQALVNSALLGAERGAALTRRLLAFSRRQELDVAPVEPVAVARGMLELAERILDPDIEIHTRFGHDVPKLLTDANQLEMALLNLVMNARDAMPEGGTIVIAIEAISEKPDNAPDTGPTQVEISVTDSGIGMDEETMTNAVKPFFTTKGRGKGTGLGLAMAQALMEQSGGTLRLQSKPGAGTCVSLVFPAMTVPTENPDATEDRFDLSGSERNIGPLTVLAVDDDALVLMNTTMMLEDLGHRPVEAYNGAEALRILEERSDIDLVITDQSMPRMTGAELATAIAARKAHLPVILATGYLELPEDKGGKLPRLPKPFTQDQLRSAITTVMS